MRFAELEAVTVDGFGTLLELEDPVAPLVGALERRGLDRSSADVTRAFAAEAGHYRLHAHTGRDGETLAALRRECVEVFLRELEAAVEPDTFVDDFLDALVFRPAEGAPQALVTLRERGLKLAVVSNWDCSLPDRLAALRLLAHFDAVVTSADAGVPKPGPEPLLLALELLGVEAGSALHVGDEEADERGARAAGMHFAPAPISTAVAALS